MDRTTVDQLTNELKALRVRAARIESAIAATRREANDRDTTVSKFKAGDRVRIKNRVKKPAHWSDETPWDKEAAQLATVTHIEAQHRIAQVHFVTDNGVTTWRAVRNLKPLQD